MRRSSTDTSGPQRIIKAEGPLLDPVALQDLEARCIGATADDREGQTEEAALFISVRLPQAPSGSRHARTRTATSVKSEPDFAPRTIRPSRGSIRCSSVVAAVPGLFEKYLMGTCRPCPL